MAWKKTLTPNDPEIIVGIEHPMRYAISIAGIIKKHGFCKVHVKKGKTFIDKRNSTRSLEDQFQDAMKMLTNIFEATISSNEAHKDVVIYVVKW